MAEQPNRTPGPWKAFGPVVTANGSRIAQTHFGDNGDADAAFIVVAVNCHDDLLAACEMAEKTLNNLLKAVPWGDTFDLDIAALNAALLVLPAAIAKARGQ